jgi:cupin superfamily acireductone dioxygenase involved in methionine salvage
VTKTNRDILISTGNAAQDGIRGWFIGQFIPPSGGLAHQDELEIKWQQHRKGERRERFAHSPKATTISILVNGSLLTRFRLPDETREVILNRPGDYIAYGPGLDHSWEALEESLVITVRFPSLSNEPT